MKCPFILLGLFLIQFNLSGQDTLIIQPEEEFSIDAEVSSNYPDRNYENHDYFAAWAWTIDGEPDIVRGFIYFNLNDLPNNAKIVSATLDLYGNPSAYPFQHSTLSGSNASSISKITEPWEEDQITWDNQPSISSENHVILPMSTFADEDYLDIDMTELIREAVDNPEEYYGFSIQSQEESPYRRLVFLSSSTTIPEKRPRLTIIYSICPLPLVQWQCHTEEKTVSFNNTSSTGDSWLWDFGDGYLSTLENPTHTYESFGSYLVCLTGNDSCGSGNYCDTITLCNNAKASFYSTVSDRVAYFSDSSINATEYWWNFGDGYFSNVKDAIHTYNEYGDFFVCLEASNECSLNSYCDTIRIFDSSSVSDDIYDMISVYPNPFTSHLRINRIQETNDSQIIISNIAGVVIKQIEFSTNDYFIDLDLSFLTPGIYILRSLDNKDISFKKLIKMNSH